MKIYLVTAIFMMVNLLQAEEMDKSLKLDQEVGHFIVDAKKDPSLPDPLQKMTSDTASKAKKAKDLAMKFGAKILDVKNKIEAALSKLKPQEFDAVSDALERMQPALQKRFEKVLSELKSDPKTIEMLIDQIKRQPFPEEAVEIGEKIVELRGRAKAMKQQR